MTPEQSPTRVSTGADRPDHAATAAPGPPPRRWRDRLLMQEDLNFLLTNRIPRIAVTRLMGRISHIRSPWLTRLMIGIWRQFTDLDLGEATQQRFDSLQQCFTRELKPGARPVDPDPAVLASPCDAIVGECGTVRAGQLWQAKGMGYRAEDLFGAAERAAPYEGGTFVTLRLTSAMYHRFHAPADACIEHVSYFGGDTWNVNPIALKRVERLFCRNERAVIRLRLRGGARDGSIEGARDAVPEGTPIALVPVAAVLVASIRLHALDVLLHVRWPGPNELPCDAEVTRGQELGWFEHGSTIIVFVPPGFDLAAGIATGARIRMGQALLRRAPAPKRQD